MSNIVFMIDYKTGEATKKEYQYSIDSWKKFCDKNNIETLFGIGGNNKSNSSSWILKKWKE